MDLKKFNELKGDIKKQNIEDVANTHQTYVLWKESGGVCPKCGKELLEILDSESRKSIDKFVNHGRRAHIISRNDTNVRPRIYDLYSKETLKKLNIKRDKGRSKIIPQKYINNKENMILLCHDDHLFFDNKQAISSIDGHEESALEMIKLKKIKTQKINHFNLVISSAYTWKSTLEILKEAIKEHKDKRVKIVFEAIKESQKYSNIENSLDSDYIDYRKEITAIDKINKVAIEDLQKETLWNKIGEIIHDYFKDGEKNASNNIEMFVFNFQYNEKIGIEISITTQKKRGSNADPSISHKELNQNIQKEFAEIVSDDLKNKWILNSAVPMEEMKQRKDYNRLKSLIIQSLFQFSKKDRKSNMDSFSVAYMARWGTGKTTLVRSLINEVGKYFRYVEINLWHIANTIADSKISEDNPFIRNIVKEALTQMAGNPEVVKNYLDATKHINVDETDADLSKKVIDNALSLPTNTNRVDIIQERNKFIDQYLHTLSNFINRLFEKHRKPIIIVFDDLDRITDNENIISILDALVAFLNIKNCIFIIPVDESKVVKALYEKKKGIDPNTFINKYFNYQIKAPFIPKLERLSAFEEVVKQSGMEINDKYKKYAVNLINPTYRDIKDFINNLNNNISLFSGSLIDEQIVKKLGLPKERLMVAATILQQNFPLYTDFLAEELARRTVLQQKFKTKQLKTINNYILNNNAQSDSSNEAWNSGKSNINDDISFWKSILGEHIDSKYIDSLDKFINIFSDEKEREKWREKILDATNKLINLDDEIKISDMNDTELLSLWAIITQADIKTQEAQIYAEVSTFHHALSQNDDESFEKTLSSVESIDLINKYFKNIDNIKDMSIIRDVEYKIAFNNSTKWIEKISEFSSGDQPQDSPKLNDEIFERIFEYNIDRMDISQEDENAFLNYIIPNKNINIDKKNIGREIEHLRELGDFPRKIQIARIIYLAKNKMNKYFHKLFSINPENDENQETDLDLSNYPEEVINELIELLDKFKKLNISQVKTFLKIGLTKGKLNFWIKKIDKSEFQDIEAVNKSNFSGESIKEKVSSITKINSENIVPKDEYIDLYFKFFKDKKVLIKKLSDKQISNSLESQKFISKNIDEYFDWIKDKYYILDKSKIIIEALDIEKFKKMINTKKSEDLLYKIINKYEHLLKLVNKLAIEGMKFNEFWKINNIQFQQIYISLHDIKKDSFLIKGLEINPRVLSLSNKMNLNKETTPWKFDGSLFKDKNDFKKLHEFIKTQKINGLHKYAIGKNMINFLYKNGYEEMYLPQNEEDLQKHFNQLSIQYYKKGVNYYFQNANEEFHKNLNIYLEQEEKINKLQINKNYENLKEMEKLLSEWEANILNLREDLRQLEIKEPDDINAKNFNYYKNKILKEKNKLVEKINKIVKDINILNQKISVIDGSEYERISEFNVFQIKTLARFKEELNELIYMSQETEKLLSQKIIKINEINEKIQKNSIILDVKTEKFTKISRALKEESKLALEIKNQKTTIENNLGYYNENEHSKDYIKAKRLEIQNNKVKEKQKEKQKM